MGKFLADITPLRESPAFRRLWLGSAVSALGSQLTLVAVSLEVYRLTQDSLYVGLLSIFALVPLVFGGLLGGSIADAHDRRTVALLASSVLWLTTAASPSRPGCSWGMSGCCMHSWRCRAAPRPSTSRPAAPSSRCWSARSCCRPPTR